MSGFIIEEERGTTRQALTSSHPHNGYYAGTFTTPADPAELEHWFAWGRAPPARMPEMPYRLQPPVARCGPASLRVRATADHRLMVDPVVGRAAHAGVPAAGGLWLWPWLGVSGGE